MSTKHKILLTTLILLCLISVSSVAMAATPTANFKANTVSGVMPLKVTFSDLRYWKSYVMVMEFW